jgi:dynein light intermediate chain 1, cytosolic
MRQLRDWLLLLRTVLLSLSPECEDAMKDVMSSWSERGRTGGSVNLDGTGAVASDGDVALPLGPGEWSDALGLPLCVVCQNVSAPSPFLPLLGVILKGQHSPSG